MEINIKIKKRKALVTLDIDAMNKRNNGLIQFLSYFADNITWKIKSKKLGLEDSKNG